MSKEFTVKSCCFVERISQNGKPYWVLCLTLDDDRKVYCFPSFCGRNNL